MTASQPHHFLSHRTSETCVNLLLSRAFRSVTVWMVFVMVEHRVVQYVYQRGKTKKPQNLLVRIDLRIRLMKKILRLIMRKLVFTLIAFMLVSPVANAAVKWKSPGEKDVGEVKLWSGHSQIPESYNPNLATVRAHFDIYNKRGVPRDEKFASNPSKNLTQLSFDTKPSSIIQKELERSFLASYIMYEKGNIVIDEKSPDQRLGDLFDNDTLLYSMSMGKSLGGYLMGHAICRGYVKSVDQKLSDWPLVENTLLSEITVRDVLNSTMGDQKYRNLKPEYFKLTKRDPGDVAISNVVFKDLKASKPGKKIFAYGQFPANVAWNYISFKTSYKFKDFLDDVMQNHIGLENTLKVNASSVPEEYGPLQSNFKATRYDTLRIGIAILKDWKEDTCVGKFLKDIYKSKVKKGRHNTGDGFSQSYAGFFHTDYPNVKDTVMGMDGYGGIALLINFDDERIIYAHAIHRNYNYKKIVMKAIKDGKFSN
jgi:hypothetical protein